MVQEQGCRDRQLRWDGKEKTRDYEPKRHLSGCVVRGHWSCSSQSLCQLILLWDNSYSRIRSKTIRSRNTVVNLSKIFSHLRFYQGFSAEFENLFEHGNDNMSSPTPQQQAIETVDTAVQTDNKTDDTSPIVDSLVVNTGARQLRRRKSVHGRLKKGSQDEFTVDGSGAPAYRWFEADAKIFNLRCGPEYKRNKKKAPSDAAVMQLVDVKMYRNAVKMKHVCNELPLPDVGSDEFHFVVNIQIPDYAPAMWGGPEDGEGWSVIMYFSMPASTHDEVLNNPQAGWAVLLKRLLEAPVDDESQTEAKAIHDRFKLIAKIMNVDDIDLDSFTRKLIDSHNAQPVLSRPQHTFFKGHNYFEVDVDVHLFPYIALKGLHSLLDRVKSMVIDVCICLEGHTDEELPERALGCVRISKMDLRCALAVGQPEYTEEMVEVETQRDDILQVNASGRAEDETTPDDLGVDEETVLLDTYRQKLRQLLDFDEDDIDALLDHAQRRSANIQELRENLEMEYILRLRKQLKYEAQNLDEEYMRMLQSQKEDRTELESYNDETFGNDQDQGSIDKQFRGDVDHVPQELQLKQQEEKQDADELSQEEEIVDEEMSVFSSVRKLSMMMLTATGLDISEDSEVVVQGDK